MIYCQVIVHASQQYYAFILQVIYGFDIYLILSVYLYFAKFKHVSLLVSQPKHPYNR